MRLVIRLLGQDIFEIDTSPADRVVDEAAKGDCVIGAVVGAEGQSTSLGFMAPATTTTYYEDED